MDSSQVAFVLYITPGCKARYPGFGTLPDQGGTLPGACANVAQFWRAVVDHTFADTAWIMDCTHAAGEEVIAACLATRRTTKEGLQFS